MANISNLPQHPLCKFADKLYADSNTSDILHTIRQRLELNLNIILFCCWSAKIGQKRLTKKDMRRTIANTLCWHEQIILPLHNMQQSLPAASESLPVNKISQSLLTIATNANHIEQIMLTETNLNMHHARDTSRQFTDAYNNIKVYCKELGIILTPDDNNIVTRLLAAIFPEVK